MMPFMTIDAIELAFVIFKTMCMWQTFCPKSICSDENVPIINV